MTLSLKHKQFTVLFLMGQQNDLVAGTHHRDFFFIVQWLLIAPD